ncbi:cell division protein ZapA [Rappaport israeli]|uniref:cell division protein ZapA n=1 Tax=Rappaport israeli TaxID=1839807 RepID=UPI00092FF4D0|nr:cell division protein ZapA [Rappaport israeli]
MSKEKIKVTLQILENSYPLMCEVHERNVLLEAAEAFNQKLTEIRRDNPKLTLERLVIFGGLQMAFELYQDRQTFANEVSTVNQVSERLLSALDMAINEYKE